MQCSEFPLSDFGINNQSIDDGVPVIVVGDFFESNSQYPSGPISDQMVQKLDGEGIPELTCLGVKSKDVWHECCVLLKVQPSG